MTLAERLLAFAQSVGADVKALFAANQALQTQINGMSGAPGGADRQLQYNNNGAFGGAGNVTIDPSGNLVFKRAAAATEPGTDQIAVTPLRIAPGGGSLFRTLDERGVYRSMQPHLARNSVGWVIPRGGWNIVDAAGINITNVGTLTTRVPTATNRVTRSRRIGYTTTAATAGLAAGWYTTSAIFTLGGAPGGGFQTFMRFSAADAAASAHAFCGLSSLTAAPVATTSPATFTNCIGVAQIAGYAFYQLVYGGSVAQTPIDLGSDFYAGASNITQIELIIYAPPDVNDRVFVRVESNKSDGTSAVFETELIATTPGVQLPLNTTFLAPRMYRSNNATAVTAAMDLGAFMYETDLW